MVFSWDQTRDQKCCHPAACACKTSHLGADWAEDQVVAPLGCSRLHTALVPGAGSVSLCPSTNYLALGSGQWQGKISWDDLSSLLVSGFMDRCGLLLPCRTAFSWRASSPLVLICFKILLVVLRAFTQRIFKTGTSDSVVCRHLVRRGGYNGQILFEGERNREKEGSRWGLGSSQHVLWDKEGLPVWGVRVGKGASRAVGETSKTQPFACAWGWRVAAKFGSRVGGYPRARGAGVAFPTSWAPGLSGRGVHGSGGLAPSAACPSSQEPLVKKPRAEAIAGRGAGAGERSSCRVKRRPQADFCSSFAVAGERGFFALQKETLGMAVGRGMKWGILRIAFRSLLRSLWVSCDLELPCRIFIKQSDASV